MINQSPRYITQPLSHCPQAFQINFNEFEFIFENRKEYKFLQLPI